MNLPTMRSQIALIPPFAVNPIQIAMNIAAATLFVSKTAAAEDDAPDGGHIATRCGPFAGLLAPAGRAALAEELAEPAESNDSRPSHFASDRQVAANVLARRIVAARELNGWSQTETAKALGYANSTQLALWEKGARLPSLVGLIALADVLSVSLDYLAGRSDDPERDVRALRRNACLRAVRTTLAAAAERIAQAFDSDERVVGAGTSDVRDLVSAAQACAAHYEFARSGPLQAALDRLEGAALKVGIALRSHDDEDARQRERLALIAANDASGAA